MEDEDIINLYFERNEDAIVHTKNRYEKYLMKIAHNILHDKSDCEECVSDTYLKIWNAVPPTRPVSLKAYLARIVRQSAIDRYRMNTSKKRISNNYKTTLYEISDITGKTTEDLFEEKELASKINEFLDKIEPEKRNIFVCRYYFMDSISDIAKYVGSTQSQVKSSLYRMRKELKKYLESEGYFI